MELSGVAFLIITLNTIYTHTKSETELLMKINNCHEPCFFSSFSALLLTALELSFVLLDKVSLDTTEQSSVSTCLISLAVTALLIMLTALGLMQSAFCTVRQG